MKPHPQLLKFSNTFLGSSFPTLGLSSENKEVIVKMVGAGNGARSLICEYLINSICSQIGFRVPEVGIIEIPQHFAWSFGTDEFDDIVQKSFGSNLSIEYLARSKALESVSKDDLSVQEQAVICAIDLFFRNVDRSVKYPNLLKDAQSNIWIIDHGSCLLFQSLKTSNFILPDNHLFFGLSQKLKSEIQNEMQKIIQYPHFEQLIDSLPDDWLVKAQMTRESILSVWTVNLQLADSYLSSY